MKLAVPRGNDEGSGSGRRGFRRRSTRVHLRKSRNPCSWDAGQGFRNPPPGTWWVAWETDEVGEVDDAVIATANDTASTSCSVSAQARSEEHTSELQSHVNL